MIKWDKRELKRLNRAMQDSLKDAAKELEKSIIEAEVTPKKTGELEASMRVIADGDSITVSYTAPHAARLYYHPEYEFSQNQNHSARGMWLEDWKQGSKVGDVPEYYGKRLKEKL